MRIEQRCWTGSRGWERADGSDVGVKANLVFVFGSGAALQDAAPREQLKRDYPTAHIVGCSTAGEIHGTRVMDDSLAVTAIQFERTELRSARTELVGDDDGYSAGRQLAQALCSPDLVHVVVLSDGLHVNGGELTRGLAESLPPGVSVTGGLSADGSRFEQTYVLLDGPLQQNTVVAIGFYGAHLHVGFSSRGGWEPFGPERLVTRSKSNVLHELDGSSALGLYEKYLGEHAAGLPASALMFPLSVRADDPTRGLVRTILGIDRSQQTMTFAGDIREGSYARLMRASTDRLVTGAAAAAADCYENFPDSPHFALLVSCVGRRLVMKQRVEEELDAVREVFGASTMLAGFYSYGEIAPFSNGEQPELHNQTMTITGFWET